MVTLDQPDQETTPREMRLYAGGPWLMSIGGGAFVVLWAINFRDPFPPTVHTVAVTVSLMAFLTGVVFTVISDTGRYVVKTLGRRHKESVEPIAALVDQVKLNTSTIGQLTAARTVDLHHIHSAEERLEGFVRTLAADVVEDLRKEIRTVGEAQDRRAATWDAQLAEVRTTLTGIRRTSAVAAAKGESAEAKAEAILAIVAQVNGMRLKLDELWERFKDLETDLAGFRLSQVEPPAKINGNGRPAVLRSIPSQPE